MPPKKLAVNEIQTEESTTVGTPVRRSTRNANANGTPAAGVTTRRASTTAESASTPAKVTRGRRGSTSSTQTTEEIVEAKPIKGRTASALAEEETQKPAPSTPTRRGRKPSVTLEAVDQEDPDKPKLLRGRRLSRANSEDPEEPEKPRLVKGRRLSRANSEDPDTAEQATKIVRGRRASTTNNSEEIEEPKSAPVRARRGSATVESESAPKTPARATGRRRGSATESVDTEVSTPAKRAGRGRKVSEGTDEVFGEEKKPAARSRRKSVAKDEESTKEEPAKPATRRGRRASTDSPSSEVVAPRTPARVTRRSSISKEDKANEPIEVVTEETSPVIKRELNIKLTPLKKRRLVEKVEAELDLSIINESSDDLNNSHQNHSMNKAAGHLSASKSLEVATDGNSPKEQGDGPRGSKRLSNEGEAACPQLKKSPRLSDQLQFSRENSPIRTSPRLSAKIINSSHARTSPRLSPKFAKSQVEQVENIEENVQELQSKENITNEIIEEKAPILKGNFPEANKTITSPKKGCAVEAKSLEKEIQESHVLEKSVSHVSTGSEGSFRFHLSTVSLPEEPHEEPLNESKESTGSNKENVDLDASTNAQNKSEATPLQPKIVARISNVFKPNQKDFSFQEPMDVDNYSMLVNDTLGEKTVGTLDESSVELSKIVKSDASDSDDCSVVFNRKRVITQSSDVHFISQLDETTSDLPSIIVETCDKDQIKSASTEIENREEPVIAETGQTMDVVNEPVEKLRHSLTRKTSSPLTNKRRSSRKSLSPASKDDSKDGGQDSPSLQVITPRKSKSRSPSPQQQDKETPKKGSSPVTIFDIQKDDVGTALLSVRRSISRSKSSQRGFGKDQCVETEKICDGAGNDSTISANKARRSVSPLAPQQIVTVPHRVPLAEVKHSESLVYDFELPSDDSDLDDSKDKGFVASENTDNLTKGIETIEEVQKKSMECDLTEESIPCCRSLLLSKGDSKERIVVSSNIETTSLKEKPSNEGDESRNDEANKLQELGSVADLEKNVEISDISDSINEQAIQNEESHIDIMEHSVLSDDNQDVVDQEVSVLKNDEAHSDVKENFEISENYDKINEESSNESNKTDHENGKASEEIVEILSEDALSTNDGNTSSKEPVEVQEGSDIEKNIEHSKLVVNIEEASEIVCKKAKDTGDSENETGQCTKGTTENVKIRGSLDLTDLKPDEIQIESEESMQEASEIVYKKIPNNEEMGDSKSETNPCMRENTITLKDLQEEKMEIESEVNIQETETVDEELPKVKKTRDLENKTSQPTKKNPETVNPCSSLTLKNSEQDKIHIESKDNSTSEWKTTDTKTSLESNKSLRSRYSLDELASAKLDEFVKSKAKDIEESDSSEEGEESENEYHEFIDGMAEEGEEDTPSEDSNQIIDEGESIGSSDSDEEKSDDNYDDDSFICDDDDVGELLSGEEYDLENEEIKTKKKSRIIDPDSLTEEHDLLSVPKKEQKVKPKKKSRIIKVSDSSDDEEGPVEAKLQIEDSSSVIILEDTNDEGIVNEGSKVAEVSQVNEVSNVIVFEDVPDQNNSKCDDNNSQIVMEDSNNSFNETKYDVATENNMESSFVQNVSLAGINNSLQKRGRRSSLSIHENIVVDGNKVPMITKRINSLVESFCSNVSKGEVSLNLSLEFEDTKQPSKVEPVHIMSDIKICPGIQREASKHLEGNQKTEAEEVDESKEIKDLREVITKNRLKRRLSRSLTELFTEEKKAKRRKKTKSQRSFSAEGKKKIKEKTRPDVSEVSNVGSFNLMSQLVTDVKNRPKRIPKPSTDIFETSWLVTPVENPKPSTKTITKKEKLKLHPKDFKNQLLSDPQRVRRVETKTLLKKKGAYLK